MGELEMRIADPSGQFTRFKVLVQKQIRTFATILPLISAPKVQSYK
jgi:hypothetical protein